MGHPARTAAIPYVSELAPESRLFDLDGPEFDRAFRERLDGSASTTSSAGSARSRERTAACRWRSCASSGTRPTATAARSAVWWQERTAEPIPQYGLTAY